MSVIGICEVYRVFNKLKKVNNKMLLLRLCPDVEFYLFFLLNNIPYMWILQPF